MAPDSTPRKDSTRIEWIHINQPMGDIPIHPINSFMVCTPVYDEPTEVNKLYTNLGKVISAHFSQIKAPLETYLKKFNILLETYLKKF